MAIFGRKTARQRLRRATRESLAIPVFNSQVDCTAWVIGGLWPAELSTVNAETASVADYLKADLQRIVNFANEEITRIRRAGMAEPAWHAEETRVINAARAFAVRRVESAVRHLHGMQQEHLAPPPRRDAGRHTQPTVRAPRFRVAALAPPTLERATDGATEDGQQNIAGGGFQVVPGDEDQMLTRPVSTGKHAAAIAEPEDSAPDTLGIPFPPESVDTDVVDTDVTEALKNLQPESLQAEDRAHKASELKPAGAMDLAVHGPAADADAGETAPAGATAAPHTAATHDTDVFATQPADDTDVPGGHPVDGP